MKGRRLTAGQTTEVQVLLGAGHGIHTIAREMQLSVPTIYNIRRREAFADLTRAENPELVKENHTP